MSFWSWTAWTRASGWDLGCCLSREGAVTGCRYLSVRCARLKSITSTGNRGRGRWSKQWGDMLLWKLECPGTYNRWGLLYFESLHTTGKTSVQEVNLSAGLVQNQCFDSIVTVRGWGKQTCETYGIIFFNDSGVTKFELPSKAEVKLMDSCIYIHQLKPLSLPKALSGTFHPCVMAPCL